MQGRFLVAVLLLLGVAYVAAEIQPRFPPRQPIAVDRILGSGNINGVVLPCDTDYWRIETFDDVDVDEYLVIDFNQTGEARAPADRGHLYIIHSEIDDLEEELRDNRRIIDTLGQLPGPKNKHYSCNAGRCIFELNCQFKNGTYYLAVAGGWDALVVYNFTVSRRVVNVTTLRDRRPVAVFNDSRRRVLNELGFINPPAPSFPDRQHHYRFFRFEVPLEDFSEGTYIVVNVSRVFPLPAPKLRLHYGTLPVGPTDNGLIGTADDNCVYPWCVSTDLTTHNEPFSDHPRRAHARVPCECTPGIQTFPDGSFQLTCNVTVDPCHFRYGTWYASLELRPSNNLFNGTVDTTALSTYTITAFAISPDVSALIRNVTFKGFVEPERATHYKIDVPANEVDDDDTHFLVHISNVRGGSVDVYVHRGLGITKNLAGGPEGCVPANATCRTCDACNIVVEKCHFQRGTWYISVNVAFNAGTAGQRGTFLIDDTDRLPITFTIRANWLNDAPPVRLLAGEPVHRFIGEALYDFYVLNVPATIDTWLFIELYVQCEDTEVILSILHDGLPGGECYERPDFYCLTGDTRNIAIPTGIPQNEVVKPQQRESCSFMIQTCELEAGPLFMSVYGHHLDYKPYGDNTFYQVPVQYTLWADFDVALSIESSVSYTETVFQNQYQHYYIRADNVNEGSSMSVEATNIQHGVPQTIEVYVNYNFLAGSCPCYDHLYNCTGTQLPGCTENDNGEVACGGASPQDDEDAETNFLPQPDTVKSCCTIVVPPCDFRSGVWYVSVLGVNEDLVHWTTPIGYTLTVTMYDAPTVKPLSLGQALPDVVAQYNKTYDYKHYKIAARTVPLHDLVIKMSYVQNCEFRPKHDNLRDRMVMYVNHLALASLECWEYRCSAKIASQSFCSVVVPHCAWEQGDWFVAVRGDFDADFDGRFTLRASVEEVRDTQLRDGVSVFGRATSERYQHYFLDVVDIRERYLVIDAFANNDQDKLSLWLNIDERAGSDDDDSCYRNLQKYRCCGCSCHWQIEQCELRVGRYYISALGADHQFYDSPTEFTLTASFRDLAFPLGEGDPITGHIHADQIRHYRFRVAAVAEGEFMLFELENVKAGTVVVYANYGSPAGRCPCYKHVASCIADSDNAANGNKNWCEIRIPPCALRAGDYYFSVVGVEQKKPTMLDFATPIGYVIEVNVVDPDIINPRVVVDRQLSNELTFEFVANGRYRHYRWDISEDDFRRGYHTIVEITDVREGALFAYYNRDTTADESCHHAKICTASLGAGRQCFWQMPYCLTRPGRHVISIEGITGRLQASFDILIWLQKPEVVESIPEFRGLFNHTTANTNSRNHVNITHNRINEPKGWVQFIRLKDVLLRDPNGDILELFFHRIRNNVGSATDFNVYLWPERPAGAHKCCDASPSDRGSCTTDPCLRTVPLTTQTGFTPLGNGDTVVSHLCSNPAGIGNGTAADNFFGYTCNATLWSCEFAKAHPATGRRRDWWVSIVPVPNVNPVAPATALPQPGLQYTFQWRVRNTRRDISGNERSSTELGAFGNQTVFYTMDTFEDWRSFHVDVPVRDDQRRRLIVRTDFGAGVSASDAVVYVNAESHANPLSCNTYHCSRFANNAAVDALGSCNCANRYINTTCCVRTNRFYISVRQKRQSNVNITFRFIIDLVDEAATIEARKNPRVNRTFTASNVVVTNGTVSTGGVLGESYDHYAMDIDDDDFDNKKSLVIVLQKIDTDANSLQLFVRPGQNAGSHTGATGADNFHGGPESCHSWQYTCTAVGNNQTTTGTQGRCVLQIPHCQIYNRQWFLSIYNPDYFTPGTCNKDVTGRSYQITAYFEETPTVLSLGVPHVVPVGLPVGLGANSNSYVHYRFSVRERDLKFNSRVAQDHYVVKYLRVALFNIALNNVDLYLNYDDVAGVSADHRCLKSIASSLNCPLGPQGTAGADPACFVTVLPCIGGPDSVPFKLTTGDYYVGVRVRTQATYTLTAQLLEENYRTIPRQSVAGAPHRPNTDNTLYRVTVTDPLILANTTRFLYTFDTQDNDDDDDDISSRDYFVANLTLNSAAAAAPNVKLSVWRDDCYRWECSITTANGFCVIDALELSPCTSKGGRYYFRVENPSPALNFTLNVFHNESTVQNIRDNQTLTEIVYPYEYNHYFYRAERVGRGSTLAVTITSSCGDVEAWIQKDSRGGPGPDANSHARSCNIDSCKTVGAAGMHELDTSKAVCQMFLDSCVFDQRGYWITVRGVNVEFPRATPAPANVNLYLPAKYHINVVQTRINYTDIDFGCFKTVRYQDLFYNDPALVPGTAPRVVPRQFIMDLETINVGATLRFSMRIPRQHLNTGRANAIANLRVAFNRSVGYVSDCANLPYSCSVNFAGSSSSCSFEMPWCSVYSGKYYIFADAPHGTEVIVERFDPIIPILSSGATTFASINGPNGATLFNNPYRPQRQHYRYDIDPTDIDFFLRVHVRNVTQGVVRVFLNTAGRSIDANGKHSFVFEPTNGNPACNAALFYSDECQNIREGDDCLIEVPRCVFMNNSLIHADRTPRAVFITVEGVAQTCEFHAVKYEIFIEQTHAGKLKRAPINEPFCDAVDVTDYNFYRVSPRAVESPQQSILRITALDVDVKGPEEVRLVLADGHYPTDECNLANGRSDLLVGRTSFDWICGYSNLHLGVEGLRSDRTDLLNPRQIDYCLNVTKIPVSVTTLTDSTRLEVDDNVDDDDDDNDACTKRDYYRFRGRSSNPNHAYLEVNVESDSATTVYVNKRSFAWTQCHINQCTSPTSGCSIRESCNYEDTTYFITVVSSGPYRIFARVIDGIQTVSLSQGLRDKADDFKFYRVRIANSDFTVDDRLVVEVGDVYYGQVAVAARFGKLPGIFTNGSGSQTCVERSGNLVGTWTPQAQGQWTHLVIDHCILQAGDYYVAVQVVQRDVRQCRAVRYTLRATIQSLRISPRTLTINRAHENDQVSLFVVPRAESRFNPRVRYYAVTPNERNSAALAQARIYNVHNGQVRMYVKRGHLATGTWAFTAGGRYGLTRDHNEQPATGVRANTWQRILDNDPALTAAQGCRDRWCDTTLDQNDQYLHNQSCAIWLDSCFWNRETFFLAVEALDQDYQDHDIIYDIQVREQVDFANLRPNTHIGPVAFRKNNWEYHFYGIQQETAQATRVRVQVVNGDGVLVTIRNHRCPHLATYEDQFWCSHNDVSDPWACEFQFNTRAKHPGRREREFFITVTGKNATYAIGYFKGRQNCHAFSGSGRSEGLDFCAGLVPYTTWRMEDYTHQDNEARCFFNELYEHFRVQPCWSGVTPECNATLARFACYESFRRCDADGFQVGTCRKACNAVTYECVNHFETVDLEHYNCSSHRYLNSETEACTGHNEEDAFANGQFLEDVNILLFESRPPPPSGAASLTASMWLLGAVLVSMLVVFIQA